MIRPLFFVGVTAVGMLEGYLRMVTDSVWPAAILHSAHNVFWAILRMFVGGGTPLATEYLAGESGLIPVTLYALLAGAIYVFGWSVGRRPLMAAA